MARFLGVRNLKTSSLVSANQSQTRCVKGRGIHTRFLGLSWVLSNTGMVIKPPVIEGLFAHPGGTAQEGVVGTRGGHPEA